MLEESDIPEEYLTVMRQMAIAGFQLAYQKADTSVSGDRMKCLSQENTALQQQLKDFPQLQTELSFYKTEYERQRTELREAYMNLNKQQLVDSDEFRLQLDRLTDERNELTTQLLVLQQNLVEQQKQGLEASVLSGELDRKNVELQELTEQLKQVQKSVGEKQAIESQLISLKAQLAEANQTVINLQAQQKSASALLVDVDVEGLQAANESLALELSNVQAQLQEFQASTKKSKAPSSK